MWGYATKFSRFYQYVCVWRYFGIEIMHNEILTLKLNL